MLRVKYRPNHLEDHPIKRTQTVSGRPARGLDLSDRAREAAFNHAMRIPSAMYHRIDWCDAGDPLRRQVEPSADELRHVEGFVVDPLEERALRHAAGEGIPGLLQKYHGRVLLQVSGECAVHCRFCFRRHDTYATIPRHMAEWAPALAAIRGDPSLREVVLSGGDPLMVSDVRLAQLAQRLAAIPHLTRLRLHSRMPVVTPKRIGGALVRWLTALRLAPIVVLHCNHAAELGPETLAALGRLLDAGIPLLNQSVLLKGVNDDVNVLAELCETLVNHRVMPYYLHLLDPVAGAAHFHVERDRARALIAALQTRLPGYAVPRLVQEQPGQPSKTPL